MFPFARVGVAVIAFQSRVVVMLLLIFEFVCCHSEWWQWPLAAVVALLLQLLPFV